MSKCAQNIKKFRLLKGYTQDQLAKKLFVTKQAVSKWETGRGYPDVQMLSVLAKALDISIDDLMGEGTFNETRNKKKIIIVTGMVTLILVAVLIGVTTYLQNRFDQSQIIEELEQRLHIELPNHGEYVSADFEDWAAYGNEISITKMSYIIFTKEREIAVYERDISENDLWENSFDQTLLPLVPLGIQSYLAKGDYYLLYNESISKYNQLPAGFEMNKYTLLIYQVDLDRLIILEYPMSFEGGSNEE